MEDANPHKSSTTISPDQIVWCDAGAPGVTGAACPVCGDVGTHAPVLQVPSMSPPHTRLTFLRCSACGSGHFDPPGITDFADLGQAREDFWRFYVEVVCGVWETLWPVIADAAPRSTLLDVGCGFGFTVDAWARLGRGEAIGVELADYGVIGARTLDITVYDKLLDECEPLAGRRFDVVYASEVIEHVPDPRAFVETLARYLEDDGLLVLTTPSMEFIKRDELSPTLHAALAPGFHGFLLSRDAFERIARECGFAHVDVRVMGERQILWASRAPFTIEPGGPASFAQYVAYLESRVGSDDPASPVWQGLAYRLVKEWSNKGEVARAHALAERLMAVIVQAYGATTGQPQELLQRLRTCAILEEVGRFMPYFLPNLYFHLGNLAIAVKGDRALARRMYEGAVDCTLECSRFGSVFFLEAISLVWPARAALADLDFMDGRIADGAKGYARLAADGDLGNAVDGYARAPLALIESRVPQRADELRRHQLYAPAAAMFNGYCEHVRRRYGDACLGARGVDEIMTRGSGELPLDPLFAPWFKVMLALGSGDAGDRSAELVAAARDVENVARRWSAHSTHGARMREIAEQIAAALGGNRRVVWSMSTTFKA